MEKRNFKILFFISFIILAELALKYFLKYHLNGISLSEFTFYNFGNILNVASSGLLLFGLIIYLFSKNNDNPSRLTFLLFLSLAIFLPLVVLLLINLFHIQFPQEYFLMYPIKKVLIGSLFIIGGTLKFYMIFFIWRSVFGRNKYLFLKTIIPTVILMIALLIFAFIHLTSFNPSQIENNDKYDVAVVLGAAVWNKTEPSPIFKGRIEKAYQLYKEDIVKKIQLTGGNAPGELTEAEAAKNYLMELGMDPKDIMTENVSAQTSQQIGFIKRNLFGRNKYQKVIIVSNEFHLDRVMEISKFFNIKPEVTASKYELSWEKLLYYMARETVALLLFWLYAI